jgi:predicted aspartyl protease
MRTFIFIALVTITLVCTPFSGAQSIALVMGQSREIPFQLVSGYLIVAEGSIGKSEHLRFILDTGTTRTCIDRRIAQQLALPLESKIVFHFDKKIQLAFTRLPRLKLGPLRAEEFTVNVADLSHLERPADHIAAIIGLDLLEPFAFQIDYEYLRLSFGTLPSLAESVSMEPIPWLPVVAMDFNHSKVRLLVDTGARNIVLYSEKLRSPSYDWKLVSTEIWWSSIGGEVRAHKVRPSDAALAFDHGYQEVYLIHAPPDDPLPTVDGLLSPIAIGIRQIGFDFNRHMVTWNR